MEHVDDPQFQSYLIPGSVLNLFVGDGNQKGNPLLSSLIK